MRTIKLEFVKPVPALEQEAMELLELFFAGGETVVNGSGGLDLYKNYDEWLAYLARAERGDKGVFIPSRLFLPRNEEGRLVGFLDIRPELPEEKLHFGHIGYSVAPPFRKKGFASAMARWGTQQLHGAGVEQVVACCYEDNRPSRRTLEAAGYVLKSHYPEEGTGKKILVFHNNK